MDWRDKSESPINNFEYALCEVKYNPDDDIYEIGPAWTSWGEITNGELELVINQEKVSETEFAEKKIKLVTKYTSNAELVCYLTKASLYKVVKNSSDKDMQPGDLDTKGIVLTEYKYVKADSLKDATDIKKLVIYSVDELNYNTYQPVYIDGAEKVRMVTIKESNYFNILQQIGETFEAWVDLQIERNEDGAVTNKFVWLKGYAGVGEINNACFRYGVNLEGIQRTHESKELVTKLIVKDNSNELAEDGYCSIAKASANLTKENYIYNFEYFHSNGMLDAKEYVDSLYYDVNSKTGVE
jgi:tRNA isopentenyl-2-thiomethyl-A-37 hydroxylase MiaE